MKQLYLFFNPAGLKIYFSVLLLLIAFDSQAAHTVSQLHNLENNNTDTDGDGVLNSDDIDDDNDGIIDSVEDWNTDGDNDPKYKSTRY